jgi:phosphoglycolate phosphatase/pyrophosphatase PpaX
MRIKAVIFDWDGTLNNSLEAIYKSYSECLKKLKLPKLSLSKYRKLYESDYRKFELKIGITPDKREISDKIWVETYKKQRVNLLPDVKEFLMKIKSNFLLGLVTGGSSERINEELHEYGLDNIFDVVITGDDTNKKKPDPEPLKICAEKLCVQPKNCIYIGDMDADIMATKKINMDSIAVTWGYHDVSVLEKAKPKFIVKKFNELFNTIKNL